MSDQNAAVAGSADSAASTAAAADTTSSTAAAPAPPVAAGQTDAGSTAASATTAAGTSDTGAVAADPADGDQQVADKTAPATLAGGDAVTSEADKAAAAAAPDWRARLAGDDKASLKTLERFASEADFFKSHLELRKLASAAATKKTLPENATPEQIAAYRKDNGIPDASDKYGVPELPSGIVLADKDKPVVALFDQFAHAENMSVAQRNKTLSWYYEVQDVLAAQRMEQDAAFNRQAHTELRETWGRDFDRNVNAMASMRQHMPDGLADQLVQSRLADGTLLGDHPQFCRWWAQLALEFDPAATLLPAGSSDGGKGITSEIDTIQKSMYLPDGSYNPVYWKDEKMQTRYRELLEARDKLAARAA